MRPAENIERLIQKLSDKTSVQMDQRVRQDMLHALEESKRTPAVTRPRIGRTIMKSPLTKLAAAAIVAIACLIGLSLWRGTQSGIALADVLARIEQVKAYTYQVRSTITTPETRTDTKSTVLISKEHGIKYTSTTVDPNNNETKAGDVYLLPKQNSTIYVVHERRMYVRVKFDGLKLEHYKAEYNDPRVIVKQILGCSHTSLGQSVIDGFTVEGFRTTDSAYEGGFMGQADFEGKPEKVDVKLWVDVDTFLPVRVEEDIVTRSGLRIQEVSYDFRWNVAVNADDFRPVIPEGYLSFGEVTVPAPNEDNAIKGLRAFASLAGEYPDNLDAVSLNKKTRKLIGFDIDSIDDLADDEKAKLTSELMSIMGPAFFYEKLVEDNEDPTYYGQTVTPKDTDQVLMRWKLSDSEYRVIYGDLHAETVSPEKLAELEKP
ncbi:MAG TPA: hypothetical protein VMW24_23280 [Sedimentisphaerales bacterium]|nr:hypothetical protein [Sedimentisphaerales bacterium]